MHEDLRPLISPVSVSFLPRWLKCNFEALSEPGMSCEPKGGTGCTSPERCHPTSSSINCRFDLILDCTSDKIRAEPTMIVPIEIRAQNIVSTGGVGKWKINPPKRSHSCSKYLAAMTHANTPRSHLMFRLTKPFQAKMFQLQKPLECAYEAMSRLATHTRSWGRGPRTQQNPISHSLYEPRQG